MPVTNVSTALLPTSLQDLAETIHDGLIEYSKIPSTNLPRRDRKLSVLADEVVCVVICLKIFLLKASSKSLASKTYSLLCMITTTCNSTYSTFAVLSMLSPPTSTPLHRAMVRNTHTIILNHIKLSGTTSA